jgi:hypothetical protein
MHIPVEVAHGSFVEALHMTKNKASGNHLMNSNDLMSPKKFSDLCAYEI